MPYFTTKDGCNIYYEIKGDDASAPTIIFLNGTMQTTLNWKRHAGGFKSPCRVITYDARAQGRSGLGERRLSPELHTSDLAGLLEHTGVEKAHLAGVSHGAYIALAFASQLPERTGRLTLCSVGAQRDRRGEIIIRSWRNVLRTGGLEAMAWAVLPLVFGENFLKENEKMLENIVKAIVRRNRKEALEAHLEAMAGYPPLSHIAKNIRAPAVILSGEQDPLVSREYANELATLCGARHDHIADAGHSIPAEVPQLFNQILTAFFFL